MKKISLLDLMVRNYQEIPRNILYSRIMCGEIFVNGIKNVNPLEKIFIDSEIEITGKKYASRGGLKLEAALMKWGIDVKRKSFLDAGSSTGGFTDCLLKFGAFHVHSVDVGYNQLAYPLRIDNRVSVYEKCNIMNLKELEPVPNAAVADLSFRSISGAGRHIIDLTSEKWLIALIKPQFEIDYSRFPEFNGIIKDRGILHSVLIEVLQKILKDGLVVDRVMKSPIKGRKGNIEFLFLIKDYKSDKSNMSWINKIGKELDHVMDSI